MLLNNSVNTKVQEYHTHHIVREINFKYPVNCNDCEITGIENLIPPYASGSEIMFKFYEPVLFKECRLNKGVIQLDNINYSVNSVFTKSVYVSVIKFHLHQCSLLESVTYEKSHTSMKLAIPPENYELFNTPGIIWQNAVVRDKKICSKSKKIKARFNPPAIIYACNSELVNYGKNYPDPVSEIEFESDIEYLIYYQSYQDIPTSQKRFDFSNFSNSQFECIGINADSGFQGSVHFYEPEKITNITVSDSTILVLDNLSYNLQTGSYDLNIMVKYMICTNLLSFDYSVKYLNLDHKQDTDYFESDLLNPIDFRCTKSEIFFYEKTYIHSVVINKQDQAYIKADNTRVAILSDTVLIAKKINKLGFLNCEIKKIIYKCSRRIESESPVKLQVADSGNFVLKIYGPVNEIINISKSDTKSVKIATDYFTVTWETDIIIKAKIPGKYIVCF